MMHMDNVADECAAVCANEGEDVCSGFDVMLQYDYPAFSQCRIYGAQSKLKKTKAKGGDWIWRSDQRNNGYPKDVINGGDGTKDTFCVGKSPSGFPGNPYASLLSWGRVNGNTTA